MVFYIIVAEETFDEPNVIKTDQFVNIDIVLNFILRLNYYSSQLQINIIYCFT